MRFLFLFHAVDNADAGQPSLSFRVGVVGDFLFHEFLFRSGLRAEVLHDSYFFWRQAGLSPFFPAFWMRDIWRSAASQRSCISILANALTNLRSSAGTFTSRASMEESAQLDQNKPV